MPNIELLPKTVYNNSNGEPKNQETAPTRYEAWDAEQMSGKTNEIITDVNNLSDNKAEQSEVDSLTSRVNQNETNISDVQANKLDDVVAGANITIDKTDPNNPVVNSIAEPLPVATDSVLGGVYFKDDAASSTLTISNTPI